MRTVRNENARLRGLLAEQAWEIDALRARAERAEAALADLHQSVFEWARVYGYPILAMTSEPMIRAAALAGSRERAAASEDGGA